MYARVKATSNIFVEHVCGSRGSRVNHAHGHALDPGIDRVGPYDRSTSIADRLDRSTRLFINLSSFWIGLMIVLRLCKTTIIIINSVDFYGWYAMLWMNSLVLLGYWLCSIIYSTWICKQILYFSAIVVLLGLSITTTWVKNQLVKKTENSSRPIYSQTSCCFILGSRPAHCYCAVLNCIMIVVLQQCSYCSIAQTITIPTAKLNELY